MHFLNKMQPYTLLYTPILTILNLPIGGHSFENQTPTHFDAWPFGHTGFAYYSFECNSI